jgi:hypothetical protein
LIYGNVLTALQRESLTQSVRTLHGAAVDANLFSAFGSNAKTGGCLTTNLILSFRRLDYVLIVFTLIVCADQHLSAIDYDVNIGAFSVFGAFVVANDDGAVRPDNYGRSVSHADPCPSVGLSLNCISRI